jgi:hypothetical protein
MNTHTKPDNQTHPELQPSNRILKLALDAHLHNYVVAMQYNGSSPKPLQRFTPKDFPTWVGKKAGGCGAQARTVHSETPTFTATSGCERLASMRFRRRQLLAFAYLEVYFVN